jgi:micrococcal nuclease
MKRIFRFIPLMALLIIPLTACDSIGIADMNATPIPATISQNFEITPEDPNTGELATVTAIIDGDTIDVDINGAGFRVRYIGINTPERDEPCSSDATAANATLVDGRVVTMYKDVSETDQYGRLLRYVYVGETFVNAVLVQEGWAEAVEYPPDTSNAPHLEDLEDAARLQGLGCWPTGVFTH